MMVYLFQLLNLSEKRHDIAKLNPKVHKWSISYVACWRKYNLLNKIEGIIMQTHN